MRTALSQNSSLGVQKAFVGLLLSALCVLNSELAVRASSGTEGAAFLDIPVGAGPASLGSAYSALASDAYAPIYNPAGLGFLTSPQLSAQHLSYLQSINYEFGSFVIPLTPALSPLRGERVAEGRVRGALGVSVQYLGAGDIIGANPDGSSAGSFSAHYAAYSLAYGRKVSDSLSLGLTGKAIQATLADVSACAYAADLGALYNAGDKLSLSATANNLGSKLTFSSQGDALPAAFHLGAAYRFENHLKSTVEGVYSKTGLVAGRFGTEWTPVEAISLRAGYKTDTTKELSPMTGLTVGLGIHLWGQEFAYAWLPYGDLGDTQYFSLLIRFGERERANKNLLRSEAIKVHGTMEKIEPNEYQQLMQLLSDEPVQNALAPAVGVETTR
jgi:hypothetical protein